MVVGFVVVAMEVSFFFFFFFATGVLVWRGLWVTDPRFMCVMGFGSPIWFWFLWVLVWRDEFAGGFPRCFCGGWV